MSKKWQDDDPLIFPSAGFFKKKKKREQANLPTKPHKTRDKRQRDIQTFTPTQQKTSHSTHPQHSTQLEQLTTLQGHTH